MVCLILCIFELWGTCSMRSMWEFKDTNYWRIYCIKYQIVVVICRYIVSWLGRIYCESRLKFLAFCCFLCYFLLIYVFKFMHCACYLVCWVPCHFKTFGTWKLWFWIYFRVYCNFICNSIIILILLLRASVNRKYWTKRTFRVFSEC